MKFVKFSALILSFALIAGCSSGSSSNGAPVNQPASTTPPAPTPPPAVQQDTRLTVGEVTGNGRVEVPVTYEQLKSQSAASLQFDINFDSSKLQMVEVRPGAAATTASKSVTTSNLSSSSTRVIIFGNNNTTIANGVVAILVFDTIGTGVANLTTSNVTVADTQLSPAPLSIDEQPGKITIQ